MFGRRRGYRRGFGGGGGGGLGMVLLAMQLVHLFQFLSTSNGYYPVTLGILGLNLVTFFRPGRNWPSMSQACISVQGAWFRGEWSRVLLASFYHTSDFHLYYNMASFIWKAISLENHFGSGYFFYMVAVFSVATNLLYVALNYALAELLDQWSYINSCAVGFSGVLFALKVVTTHIQPAGMTRVMGFIPVPMRIACWVELVLISVLFPHVSFIGHLAGILVGFAYVYGPLEKLMSIPLSLITGTLCYFATIDLEGPLPDSYRKLAIIGVGLFMMLFPLLIDLVPSGTAGGDGRAHSYTYRAGTTGRGGAGHLHQGRQERPAPQSPQSDTREYHSYTYASGTSGRRENEESEEAELQEAIRRSLQRNDVAGTSNSEETETTNNEREPCETDQSAASRPPPYNPDYTSDDVSGPEVGWNRDLLEQNEDDQPTGTGPIGFEGLNHDSSFTSNSMEPGLRHRRNHTEPGPLRTEREFEERERGGGEGGGGGGGGGGGSGGGRGSRSESEGSLTREEMREARLLRLGGARERRPLSDLAGNSFSFRK